MAAVQLLTEQCCGQIGCNKELLHTKVNCASTRLRNATLRRSAEESFRVSLLVPIALKRCLLAPRRKRHLTSERSNNTSTRNCCLSHWCGLVGTTVYRLAGWPVTAPHTPQQGCQCVSTAAAGLAQENLLGGRCNSAANVVIRTNRVMGAQLGSEPARVNRSHPACLIISQLRAEHVRVTISHAAGVAVAVAVVSA